MSVLDVKNMDVLLKRNYLEEQNITMTFNLYNSINRDVVEI